MIKGKKHIVHLSIMFLTVFVGAFTINALCDLEIIDYGSNLLHQHEEHDNEPHHAMAIEDHHGASGHHNHGTESEDDPCCDEAASSLESSLYFSHLVTPLPTVKYFLLKTIDFSKKSILNHKQTNIIYHEYDTPPPLVGYDLRVVIQSFLN